MSKLTPRLLTVSLCRGPVLGIGVKSGSAVPPLRRGDRVSLVALGVVKATGVAVIVLEGEEVLLVAPVVSVAGYLNILLKSGKMDRMLFVIAFALPLFRVTLLLPLLNETGGTL